MTSNFILYFEMISLDIPRDLVTEEMLVVVRKGWVMGYDIGRPIVHFLSVLEISCRLRDVHDSMVLYCPLDLATRKWS